MSTISDRIKTDENRKIIEVINYIGEILRDLDPKLYSKFVEESFKDENETLDGVYLNLLEKMRHLKF